VPEGIDEMKVDTFFYGLGENSVLVVNRGIVHGFRDAGMLRHDRTPPLNPAKGGVDWDAVGKMRDQVVPGADVAVCQASISLEVIHKLREKCPDTMVVLQRDSTHCQEWHDLVHAEMDKFGIQYKAYGKSLLDREKEEYRLVDRITVLSRWVQSTFEKHGLGDKVVWVGPQTFDREKWPKAPAPVGRTFRVLFAGQTGFRKGLWYLLEAWRRLSLRNAQLIIAGVSEPAPGVENEMNAWIRQQVMDTPSCSAIGFHPFAKMRNLYADCHALCIPSMEEGSSMTILEAMSVGRPVIASTHAGADVVQHGENGMITDAGEWEPIADAIAWYYDHRKIWAQHAEAASRSVNECGTQDFGRRYVGRVGDALRDWKEARDG